MEKEIPRNSMEDSNDKVKKDNVKHVFKKRSGTSGVTGQLYETKLLSLVLFRALRDKEINNFYLGSNLDDIGAFDDICLNFEFDNKTVAAFIQAKHRDDPRKGGITDSDLRSHKNDFSLEKYFDSYLKIKQKFDTKLNSDIMFSDKFDNAELCFIIYTTACDKLGRKKNKNYNIYEKKIIDLISTRGDEHIFQINYDENDINMLSDLLIEEKINTVATALIECLTLSAEPIIAPSQETIDVLFKYQSFLIPDVLQILEQPTEGLYEAKINPDLYYSKELILIKLRQKIFENVLSKTEYNKDDVICSVKILINGEVTNYDNSLFSYILNETIGNILIYNNKLNKMDLAATAPKELQKYRHDISKISISLTKFREILQERAKEKMQSASFRLPLKLNNNHTDEQTAKTIFNEEKVLAKQFLDKLYFFTRQAKQNEVEHILKIELDRHNQDHNQLIRMHCEAVFLKLHDKVQKWAMLQGNSYYLTHCCDFVEKSRKEIIDFPYITVLNFFSRNELRKHNIQFSNHVIDKIMNDLSSGVTNIVTRVKVLTCIKLMQGLPEEKCSFINLELIKNLRPYEANMLYQELDALKIDTLVIIYYELDHDASYILDDIVARFTKNIIIVSNVILSTIKGKYNYRVLEERGNSLACLDQDSQERLLAYDQVIVQGQVVSLSQILFNEECKDIILINDEIIDKILKNEILIIGNNLEDEKYVSTKDYYLPRYLYHSSSYDTHIKVDSLESIKSSVVVLTAEPGMGKSTLLTHISIETKKTNPNCWIARVNLLDHSSELFKWQKERRNIGLHDTMTLICKAELGNITGNFEFQVTEGVLALKNCDLKGLDLLKLQLIIRCYNNDALIFIFDGFDEICPHYKDEALKLIRSVIPKKKQKIDDDYNGTDDSDSSWDDHYTQALIESLPKDGEIRFFDSNNDKAVNLNNLRRVWIASRPYDSIKYTLEIMFDKSFKLKALSVRDHQIYYQKYFHDNIKLHELSSQQFKNIEGFFEFMSQYRRKSAKDHKIIHVTSIPLKSLYEAAVDHFRNDILFAPIDVDKEKLRNEWVSSKELLTILETCSGSLYKMNDAYKLAGNPLQMNVAAYYFVSQIKDTENKREAQEKWDLNLNTSDYYQCFLETKLKTIQLQEKNRRNMDYPDERLFYEKDMKEYIDMHKKLAYYAMFHKRKFYLRTLVSRKDLSAIKKMIQNIKEGKEKSGLIYRINRHDNVPMFVHKSFAEYFAVEHITDKLKLAKSNRKKQILDLIINGLLLKDQDGLLSMFDNKLKYDEELKKAISDTECKKMVFDLLLEQNDMTTWKCVDFDFDDRIDPYEEVKITPALNIAIGSGMSEVTMFFLNALEGNLNEENIEIFVELTKDTFFVGAALNNANNIITFVLDKFRSLNSETLTKVLRGTNLSCFLHDSGAMKSNEDILAKLHAHARHLTTPYWYYDNETDRFESIYFNDSLS